METKAANSPRHRLQTCLTLEDNPLQLNQLQLRAVIYLKWSHKMQQLSRHHLLVCSQDYLYLSPNQVLVCQLRHSNQLLCKPNHRQMSLEGNQHNSDSLHKILALEWVPNLDLDSHNHKLKMPSISAKQPLLNSKLVAILSLPHH